MRKILFVLIGVFLSTGFAMAIVVADYTIATNTPTGLWDLNWDYNYTYNRGSAVAVGEYWILTAAHLADDITAEKYININGVIYYPQETIFHAAADDPDHSDKADLALVRFDKPFPGYYPLYTPANPNLVVNKLAVMVGYGRTGTVYSTYYTITTEGRGVKRWGSNKIDQTYTHTDGDVVATSDGFLMLFNLGNTTYEAGLATYDSGGGTFIEDGGVWKLAGINTAILSSLGGNPNINFAVSIPEYATWITDTMDEVTGDNDSDGLPNWWEEQYGTNIIATVDQDGDGFTGEEEYVANTNPIGSNSFWQVDGIFTATNQTFVFEGSRARQYQVFYTTNDLTDPVLNWVEANTNKVWGAGTNSFITVTNTEDTVFYRLRVSLP